MAWMKEKSSKLTGEKSRGKSVKLATDNHEREIEGLFNE